MADVYEQNLGSKSSLTTSDYIRVVGKDNVSYKQSISNVASTMGIGWTQVYSGTAVTADTTITLSGTGKLYALLFSDSSNSTGSRCVVMYPYCSANQAYFIPIAFGGTLTYVRVFVNGTSLRLIAVGNSSIYLHYVYTIL